MPTQEQIIKALCKVFPEGTYSNRDLELIYCMFTAGVQYGAGINAGAKFLEWKPASEAKESDMPIWCYCKVWGYDSWQHCYRLMEYDNSFLMGDGHEHEVFIDTSYKEPDDEIPNEYIFHKPSEVVDVCLMNQVIAFVELPKY